MRRIKLFLIFSFLPMVLLADNQAWQVFKSTHFLIYYKSASENELNLLSQKAEECYNNIADELGLNRFDFWTWDNRASIYLYDTKDEYLKATDASDWSAGQAVVKSKLIQTFLTAPGFLDNILMHELAHIIFREMVGFNNPAVPVWLEEGVATFQQKQYDFQSVESYLVKKINSNTFMSLSQLNKFDLRQEKDKNLVELFYFESYSLLNYLIKEFGKDKFVLFCQSLRDYLDLTKAFRFSYSFDSLDELESSWKAYILK
jgi:hypothetical protein